MYNLKSIQDFVNEENITFQELYVSKNKWIQLKKRNDRREIANNLYVLIDNSYGVLGGHPSIRNIDDIFNDKMTYWEAVDIDTDPEADTVIFGRKTKNGIKISGMGHDGIKNSRSELMKKLAAMLNKPGYWMEASDRVAELLYSMKVPYLEDEMDVQRIFKDAKMLKDRGNYEREVSRGVVHTETIFGRPLIRQ